MLNHETKNVDLGNNQKRNARLNPAPRSLSYKHVLAPTSLAQSDRAALNLAFELAAIHRAKLTVLHVLPDENTMHWLDAFGYLHEALDRDNLGAGKLETPQQALPHIRIFLEREVPEQLRKDVELRVECCVGEVADQIVRIADEGNADLVILSGGQPHWWSAALPATVRRVLRTTERQVVLVRGDSLEPQQPSHSRVL